MRVEPNGPIDYRSHRLDPQTGPAEFIARYRPTGLVRPPTSLETFLTVRDGLWTIGRDGEPRWLAIAHDAWPLQDAEVAIAHQSMADAAGITVQGPPDHIAFSRQIDVVAWRPVRLDDVPRDP